MSIYSHILFDFHSQVISWSQCSNLFRQRCVCRMHGTESLRQCLGVSACRQDILSSSQLMCIYAIFTLCLFWMWSFYVCPCWLLFSDYCLYNRLVSALSYLMKKSGIKEFDLCRLVHFWRIENCYSLSSEARNQSVFPWWWNLIRNVLFSSFLRAVSSTTRSFTCTGTFWNTFIFCYIILVFLIHT